MPVSLSSSSVAHRQRSNEGRPAYGDDDGPRGMSPSQSSPERRTDGREQQFRPRAKSAALDLPRPGGRAFGGYNPSIPSIKLFVGSIPFTVNEADLRPLFARYGNIVELTVQRQSDGRSKGCAWLRYATKAECDACIKALHNTYQWRTGPGWSPMQVRYAIGEFDAHHNKLFMGGIPAYFDDRALTASLADTYGPVIELISLRRGPGQTTNAVMVKFCRRESVHRLLLDSRRRNIYLCGVYCPTVRVSHAHHHYRHDHRLTDSSTDVTDRAEEAMQQQEEPLQRQVRRSWRGVAVLLFRELYRSYSVCHSLRSCDALTQDDEGVAPATIPAIQWQPAYYCWSPVGASQYRYPFAMYLLPGTPPGHLTVANVPPHKNVSDLTALLSPYGTVLHIASNEDEHGVTTASVVMGSDAEASAVEAAVDGYVFPDDEAQEPLNVIRASPLEGVGGPSSPPNDIASDIAMGKIMAGLRKAQETLARHSSLYAGSGSYPQAPLSHNCYQCSGEYWLPAIASAAAAGHIQAAANLTDSAITSLPAECRH
ncbi:hypothetical protein FOZ61_007051 [Perkinsus olseni]|uniref:RRM domain-containing protein n=1 Tax=Perkinsus olseni TaxID=32597 RepID=A0A7J6LAM9_PEROL|nr:hypothetical protein FOZ61_007051 [Perkinsus olseni]